MKYTTSHIMLAACLLALPIHSNAQTTLSPSGNTLNLNFGGWQVDGVAPSGSTAQYDYWAGPQNAGNTVSYSTSFVAPSGYLIEPGWQGTFSATATKVSGPNGNNGFFFAQDVVPSNFGANIPLGNIVGLSGYSFQYVPSPVDNTSNLVTVTYDFSGLSNGYLPAGTAFFATDVDIGNNTEGPLVVSATLASGSGQYFDYLWAGPYSTTNPPGIIDAPTVDWDGTNTYTIAQQNVAPRAQTDASVFLTTQNLTSLTVTSQSNLTSVHALTFAGQMSAVPEPSGVLLLGITGFLGLMRRRRAC